MGIRVFLVEDHTILRDGLRSLVTNTPDMQVVGEAADGRRAVRSVKKAAPDVVIMDVTLPEMNGIEATRQLVADSPGLKVIGLSVHADQRFVAGMFQAGAAGYLLKDCAFEELVGAIRIVMAGRTYLGTGVADVVVGDYTRRLKEPDSSVFTRISPREREVLQLLAEGRSAKQIAGKLHVSVKTVETHRGQIMRKLDIHSIAELTKYAIREGLTALEL